MAETASARVRRRLNHPVVDADGHWLETMPVFLEFLGEVAGGAMVDEFRAKLKTRYGHSWFAATPEERVAKRIAIPGWWSYTTRDLEDRAASMVPSLFHARLDDWGFDYSLVYPTMGLELLRIEEEPMRRALVRAYNTMVAEMFGPYADRLTPAGLCALNTPDEAIEEATHAVKTLGLKVLCMNCTVPRPIPADVASNAVQRRIYIDNLSMDSAFDYEPVWRALRDLRVAVTNHIGSMGWPDRNSPSNFVAIHVGHFAQANHTFARGLFMSGVLQRNPDLHFGLLEGGAGWACSLLADLCGHWRTRNAKTVDANCRPDRLDRARLREMMEKAAHKDRRFAGKIEDILARNMEAQRPFLSAEELTARHLGADDFSRVRIDGEDDIRRLMTRTLFVGCEADDPMTPVAFDERHGFGLKPVLGSDISHFDVTDATEVLEEAWEMVEHGLVNEQNFRDFTFTHAVQLHGGMNPDFFKGTAVEAEAATTLAQWASRAR